jgi:glutamine amidotransferase
MITIVNYGLGNVSAFVNMYKRMNISTKLASTEDELFGASRLILPGVGSFDTAMELLQNSGMRELLDDLVLNSKVPVLGVCVGMQIMAESSDEGRLPGLGWFHGHVRSFSGNPKSKELPMPHMGWNDVIPGEDVPLFNGLENDARFYFLHSYYFDCEDQADVAGTSRYGFDFSCSVRRDHVYGVQFHPEKSHHWGSALLKNFAEI